MLLAAGIKMQAAKVIPVIIDTDETNGNTTTTLNTIKNYRIICDTIKLMDGQKTAINKKQVTKTSIFATEIDEPRIITISGTNFGDLKTIVGENASDIDPEIKKVLRILYNNENLDMPLTYGFIGHPNVGSVVLSYLFQKNEEFRNTIKGIGSDDKIFLISSIFGGTGAAGFPLLLNIFNNSKETGLNKKNNFKGALSVIPYYGVGDNSHSIGNDILDSAKEGDGSKLYKIDSSLFDAKTFAAQLYYDNYIDGDIDIMYYVGDKKYKSQYANSLGGENQNNPAHVVEVYGALSIIHFDNQKPERISNKDDSNTDAKYSNSILNSDNTKLTAGKNEELRNSLIRLWMFRRFYINYLPKKYLDKNPLPSVLQQIGYTENSYSENGTQTFPVNMKAFLNTYKEWAEQLKGIATSETRFKHDRTFLFVDTSVIPDDECIHDGFEEYKPKTAKGLFGIKAGIVQSDFLGSLNKVALKNDITIADVNTKLVRFAVQVIDDIINNKMN
jgi:hypothetical protein